MRPLLLQLAPVRLKIPAYYRFYRNRRINRPKLYKAASLHYATAIKMRLSTTDEGHGNIAFTGIYELDLTRILVQKARIGGLFIDVGANYGYYSLLWAAQNPNNRVIAFEASPRNQPHIAANIRNNSLDNVISLRPEAVGKENDSLQFDLGPEGQTGWGGISLEKKEGQTVTVPVIRLDDVVNQAENIEVLKIDIEGADTWVLMGAEKLLRSKRIKHIFYEENKERMRLLGIKTGEAKRYLLSLGYHVKSFGREDASIVEYHSSLE